MTVMIIVVVFGHSGSIGGQLVGHLKRRANARRAKVRNEDAENARRVCGEGEKVGGTCFQVNKL